MSTKSSPAERASPSWPPDRQYAASALVLHGREFRWGERTYIAGILNLTPDSFSGDGLDGNPDRAVAQALAFEAAGADLLDLGAESSRPGAEPIDAPIERQRLLPALRAVRSASSLPISVDTTRASVAEAALDAGADAINDIWGLRRDAGLAPVVASAGAALIAMHNQRGRPAADVAAGILVGLRDSLRVAAAAGVDPSRIIVDPGFGFGWQPEQNLEMLRRLPELWELGLPILVGTSRKSTIGLVLDAPVEDRMEGTAATVAISIAAGADLVRVHDVAEMVRVARVADAVVRGLWRAPERDPQR